MPMRKQVKLLTNSKIVKPRPVNLLARWQQNNKQISILYLTILAALLGATGIFSVRNLGGQKYTADATKASFANTVSALGRIELEGKVTQLTPTPDLGNVRVSQLLVTEGDRVTKGQTIALLDNYQNAKAAIKFAQANLATAKAGLKPENINPSAVNLKQLKEELNANEAEVAELKTQLTTEKAQMQAVINRRRAELSNVKSELQRHQQLAQDGVISRSELDYQRLKVNTKQNSYFEAQSSYNFTIRTLERQINQAQAKVRQNENTLQEQIDAVKVQVEVEQAQAQTALKQAEKLKFTYLKAPIDGQITKIHVSPGATVGEEGVAELTDTKAIIVAEVAKNDISKVKVGQTANIRSLTSTFAGRMRGEVKQVVWKTGKENALDGDSAVDVNRKGLEVEIHLDSQTSDRLANLINSEVIIKINK